MNLLRRVPAPRVGDVFCFTVGLIFNGVLAEAEQVIRKRNVVEEMVAAEIERRYRREGLTEDLGGGALSYIMGAVHAADGLTTVDVSIWSRKVPRVNSAGGRYLDPRGPRPPPWLSTGDFLEAKMGILLAKASSGNAIAGATSESCNPSAPKGA